MALELSQSLLMETRQHAEETYPHECCGLIIGKIVDGNKRVLELHRTDNRREDEAQQNRFLIDPDDFVLGEIEAQKKSMDIIGIYHSHPNAEARPSEFDREHAWPWFSYVIVSVKEGKACDNTSWVLDEDRSQFAEEEIISD